MFVARGDEIFMVKHRLIRLHFNMIITVFSF